MDLHAKVATQATDVLAAITSQVTSGQLRDTVILHVGNNGIVTEEQLEGVADDLLNLEGMTRELAARLSNKGVKTREDLAELAVDEVVEMTGIDEERAKEIILKARAHWFE